jgi:hypothetical protein
MDRRHFDALTRRFVARPSRRAALSALLGAGLAGLTAPAAARKKRKGRKKPRCLTAFTCCGTDEATCLARCCSGRVGVLTAACEGQLHCARSQPGEPCASANDCQFLDRGACVSGVCVADCAKPETCCGPDEATCQARCCSRENGFGGIACGGDGQCGYSQPRDRCGIDDDCVNADKGLAECRAGHCCARLGGECFSAADCCTAGAVCDDFECSA